MKDLIQYINEALNCSYNEHISEKLVINKNYTNPTDTSYIDDDMNSIYCTGKKQYSTFKFPKTNDDDDSLKLDDKTISRITYQLSNNSASQDMKNIVKKKFYNIDLDADSVLMSYDWKDTSWSKKYSEAFYTNRLTKTIRFALNNEKFVNTCYFTIMKNIHILFVETTEYFAGICYFSKSAEILKYKNKVHRICSAVIFKKK